VSGLRSESLPGVFMVARANGRVVWTRLVYAACSGAAAETDNHVATRNCFRAATVGGQTPWMSEKVIRSEVDAQACGHAGRRSRHDLIVAAGGRIIGFVHYVVDVDLYAVVVGLVIGHRVGDCVAR